MVGVLPLMAFAVVGGGRRSTRARTVGKHFARLLDRHDELGCGRRARW